MGFARWVRVLLGVHKSIAAEQSIADVVDQADDYAYGSGKGTHDQHEAALGWVGSYSQRHMAPYNGYN